MEGWLARVEKTPSGCWIWRGKKGRGGYGQYGSPEPGWPAANPATHRYGYEHLVGPIPPGLELDHLCHTRDLNCRGGETCQHRLCVNPEHLEPVTHADNMKRGRLVENRLRRLLATTHCPKGHALTPENTFGLSQCRLCKNARIKILDRQHALVLDPCGVVSYLGNACLRTRGHEGRHHGQIYAHKG